MQAVLVARTDVGGAMRLGCQPRVLWPLLDRPFVQHVVESLVDIGAEVIHFLVDAAHNSLESVLGDGSRWGVRLVYHLVGPRDCPYALAWKVTQRDGPRRWLLGHADRLPCLGSARPDGSTHYFLEDDLSTGASVWSGWSWLDVAEPEHLPHGLHETELGERLGASAPEGQRRTPILWARSATTFLTSVRAAFDGFFPGLTPKGRQLAPGIWVGRQVRIHPEAQLLAPVYLGEGTLVRRGARVGPYVAVGSHSVLDRACVVEHAVVLADTYVGPGLHLSEVVCDGPQVEDVHTGEIVHIDEECLLGRVSHGTLLEDFGRWWTGLGRFLMGSVTNPVGTVTGWWSRSGPGEQRVLTPYPDERGV
jgi:hypothetical protein